jgi:site-specific recombinase XerD
MKVTKRRKVKSVAANGPFQAADAHEHGKDFLAGAEVKKLIEAAKKGRHGVRDHLPVLMLYCHGLRVSARTSTLNMHACGSGASRTAYPPSTDR